MIKAAEFARRRRQLMEMAGADSVILVSAASERIRNNDVHYPFRQDSDFLYLTGFPEPDAVLVLVPDDNGGASRLYCRPRDPKRELWDGPMVGTDQAVEDYGMDEAFPIQDFETHLPNLLTDRDKVYLLLGRDADLDQQVLKVTNEMRDRGRKGPAVPEEIIALNHLLHEMRLVKSRDELRAMRRAAKVSAEAHRQAMRCCRPGMNEAEIHGELLRVFHGHGCEPSYLPIVGGGANACTLHYIRNDQPLEDGTLLLIDAGAEFQGYAADITRTFAVNGRFSAEQKAVYEVVLAAQEAAIDAVRPGRAYNAIHQAAVRTISEGLIELGLLEGDLDEVLESESYRQFYMHNTGHWLGLDVHDVGDYRIDDQSRELEVGMVTTVEPGVYVHPQDQAVAERWRGIGIRIEDDVAVGRDGPNVLSRDVPRRIQDIEQWMAG